MQQKQAMLEIRLIKMCSYSSPSHLAERGSVPPSSVSVKFEAQRHGAVTLEAPLLAALLHPVLLYHQTTADSAAANWREASFAFPKEDPIKLTSSGGKSIPCSLDMISKASLDKRDLQTSSWFFINMEDCKAKIKDSFCPQQQQHGHSHGEQPSLRRTGFCGHGRVIHSAHLVHTQCTHKSCEQ